MVVTCPACNTSFSLGEKALPGDTAKVRCSRCRHIFRITREGHILEADWQPPEAKVEPAPSRQLSQEIVPEPAPPEPSTFKAAAPEAAGPGPDEAAEPPEVQPEAPSRVRRRWFRWLALGLGLLVGAWVGLGWWYAGKESAPAFIKPVAQVIQQLKERLSPQKAVAPSPMAIPVPPPEGKTPPPAPVVVTPPPLPEPTPDLQELKIDLALTHYQFLPLPQGGRLLILRGEVVNSGKTPRGPVRLKAALVDAQHRTLREAVVYSGTTVTDEELKTLNLGDVKGWLDTPGGRAKQPVLKPGEKQPFAVIFFDLPESFQEGRPGYQVWAVAGPKVAESP